MQSDRGRSPSAARADGQMLGFLQSSCRSPIDVGPATNFKPGPRFQAAATRGPVAVRLHEYVGVGAHFETPNVQRLTNFKR